ncbi:MAG: DUF222 domain-containing protein [Pseudolysinimonas sp.]
MTQGLAERVVERASELVALLARPSDDPGELMDSVRAVGELRRLVDGLGVEIAGRIETLWHDESDKPIVRAIGERSPHMVLQAYAGLDAAEAFAWCRVGAALRPEVSLLGEVLPARHEMVANALADGRLRVGAADRILSAVAEIEARTSVAERLEVESFLVNEAPGLTDRQFARLCRSVPAAFEPESLVEREALLRARCGVEFRRRHDGLTQMIVTMDPESEGFITTGLDARTAPRRLPTFSDPDEAPAEADMRPLRQRRLDAMVSILRESLAHDTGRVAGTSVTMHVTVALDALVSGLGTAKIAGVDEPITASAARRLSAVAEIIPVVLGSESEPLDLGRAVRLATQPQRDALAIRDGGCIWPMCDAPPAWCEVAHVTAWASGGGTDLDNLMLMCAFHHRCFDNDGWQLHEIAGERCLIPPAWVDSARTPRRAGRAHALAA